MYIHRQIKRKLYTAMYLTLFFLTKGTTLVLILMNMQTKHLNVSWKTVRNPFLAKRYDLTFLSSCYEYSFKKCFVVSIH